MALLPMFSPSLSRLGSYLLTYVLFIDACKLTGKSMQNNQWVDLAHTLLLRLPLLLFIFASPDDCRHRHG